MNFILALCAAVSLCCVATTFAQDGCYGEGPIPTRDTDFSPVASGAEDFAMEFFYKLYGKLRSPNNNLIKSFIISPFSLWSVLNLAYLGSDSATAGELKNVLRVANKSMAFYGSSFIKTNLKKNKGTTFASLDKGYFDPSLNVQPCPLIHQLEEVDFGDARTADLINDEVSRATKNQIRNLFSSGDIANSVFVLLNAIYFKGTWVNQFDPKATQKRMFHDRFGQQAFETDMMVTEAVLKYAYVDGLNAKVVELPYESSNISMILILPDVTKADNFDLVFRKVPFRDDRHDAMNVILNALTLKKVYVVMPKFTLSTKLTNQLIEVLQDMGARTMFNQRADFTRFTNQRPLFVSRAVQLSKIIVDEHGTVATAATGLIGTRSGSRRQEAFIADRPFIFMLRDMYQGVTLFSGIYATQT